MKRTKLILSAVAMLTCALASRANTLTPQVTDDTFPIWSYTLNLTSGEIHSGDGFTIYDFGGFVSFVGVPAFWTATVTATGVNPWGVAPLGLDSASEANLTFTYSGPSIEVSVGATPFAPFDIRTSYLGSTTDDWTSRDHLLGKKGTIDGGPADP